MAELNKTSKGILGENSQKIGSYTESTGGGTPLAKGEKLKDHPEAKRVQQPRDEDGQFTYNSVNGHGLKYGPSRGTTVPPFLRGMKLTFCEPGTKLKIDGDDGIEIRLMTIKMSVAEIVASCKHYIESEEGFAGMGEGSSIKKMGRKSAEEKEAKAGQAGYTDPSKLSAGTQAKMKEAAERYKTESSQIPELEPTVNGYKVLTDILKESGETERITPRRYWERNKDTGSSASSGAGTPPTPPIAPSGTGSGTPPTPPSGARAGATEADTVSTGTGTGTGSEASAAAPTAPESMPKEPDKAAATPDTGDKEGEKKILESMGLGEKDMEPEMSFNPDDTKNPKEFYSKYKSTIDSMVKQFNDKYGAEGKKINAGTIVMAIRTGKLKSMETWKKAIEK